MLASILRFFLENKLVTTLLLLIFIGAGLVTSPFDWDSGFLPDDPVSVDAIPNIGENQQIVFAEWPGRSPQDIEDQLTYPLTTALVGIPGVKSIRSISMFGFTSIYLIFEDNVEFYWSRSRILEKLNSLPANLLPDGVQPALGPDATALGQIFWYTLEGQDKDGNTVGGWELDELRSIQDFYVRYGLSTAEGVSEVASIGGYVKEYQVDVMPEALLRYELDIMDVIKAVRESNRDVGAHTFELNRVEYMIRGLGYVKTLEDFENAVIRERMNIPIRVKDVARVQLGPAPRTGVLDKSGAEVVGGVVVARYGANPMKVIESVKERVAEISAGLPEKRLPDGTLSKVTVVPFYDRTELIKETLGTLESALTEEILITILVVLVMVFNLRAAFLISSLLPVAVLMTFIAMRAAQVEANIVALSGIAIAIGTMVDMGIVMTENIIRHLRRNKSEPNLEVIYRASAEVAPAILTAISTTIVSFLPVFALQAAEGKLFQPLAFTKTFALVGALIITIIVIPAMAHILFPDKVQRGKGFRYTSALLLLIGAVAAFIWLFSIIGWILLALSVHEALRKRFESTYGKYGTWVINALAIFWVTRWLTDSWMPLGAGVAYVWNYVFILLSAGLVLGLFMLIIRNYRLILGWCLQHKAAFLSIPLFLFFFGLSVWQGFGNVFGFIPAAFDKMGVNIRTNSVWSGISHALPGLGKEFMPALDEGAFLLMPTTMPHTGVEENTRVLQLLDMAVTAIPEVELVVGKAGRVESALDPAPMSMFENVILYKSEYKTDVNGRKIRFKVDDQGEFVLDQNGEPIPDAKGRYFRQWRDHIKSPDDIWSEIVRVTSLPGVTSAPKLQPIETRLVMLQTGLRAPIGIKVKGPNLETIEQFSRELESLLKEVPSVKSEAVFADRVVGKPYLNVKWNREALARYGLSIASVQEQLEMLVGSMELDRTVEGRERYAIRVRYPRELRDSPEALQSLLISGMEGQYIPLGQLAELEFVQGPDMIRSEDTFLVSYVILDKRPGFAEVNVVEEVQRFIKNYIDEGRLIVPPGVNWTFTGNYENQIRAEKRLSILIPLILAIIFIIIYLQFRKVSVTLMIFSGIAIALSGGFIMIWLAAQPWFLDGSLGGVDFRELFNMRSFNLSVAVWVGFIALFGIATDDGVVMATYLDQSFQKCEPQSIKEIRNTVIMAGMRRIRPCLMTTATTILALLPILTSTGRGADIMIPMAIPIVGGMAVALITIFVVPVLYALWQEIEWKRKNTLNA
jgi:Cu(I)/Ag(I) efflux system membrane protein CusA/SilA